MLLFCSTTSADVTLAPVLQENADILPLIESNTQYEPYIAPPYGSIARGYLTALSDDIGARNPGSLEEQETSAFIRSALEDIGYTVETQPFSFETEDDETLDSVNVIAEKKGLSNKTILVGAHYDSVDDGDGADDNAASVAVLLELAEQLQDTKTPYTILFAVFGAEEADLDGSRYYVQQIDQTERKNTIGMINLDSLIAGDILYLYGDKGVFIRDCIYTTASDDDIVLETRTARELDDPDGTPCECADYSPFQKAGIPFAYLEATNWNEGEEDGLTQVEMKYGEDGLIRHTRFDTTAYIDSTFPGRIDERLSEITRLLYDSLTGCKGPDT